MISLTFRVLHLPRHTTLPINKYINRYNRIPSSCGQPETSESENPIKSATSNSPSLFAYLWNPFSSRLLSGRGRTRTMAWINNAYKDRQNLNIGAKESNSDEDFVASHRARAKLTLESRQKGSHVLGRVPVTDQTLPA